MPDTTTLLSQFYFKIDGENFSEALNVSVQEATVENSLHLPAVATITLKDADLKWIDDAKFAPGKALEISAKLGDAEGKIFDGEIVEIEPELLVDNRRVTIRAFDRLHRLSRGRKARTFLNVKDSDLVRQIANEHGLSSQADATDAIHQYVLQDNVTNLEFLRQRAASLGFLLYVEAKKLHFKKHGGQSPELALDFGAALHEFRPRLSLVDQVDSATVRGWDPKRVSAVVGKAQNGKTGPAVGDGKPGGAVAKSAFGAAEVLVADRPIREQGVAQKLAEATIARRDGRYIEAEGVAAGHPGLNAGVTVNLTGVGTRFSGKYFVTSATHTYHGDEGYMTRFTVSGLQPTTLLNMLGVEVDGAPPPRLGLVIGVVTDNVDPEGMCRVKVKFPWLTEEHASDWARLVAIDGGKDRGFQFIPEVNDEVVVAFEHGDVNYPYILGGLWNGKAAPPAKTDKVVGGGKVKQRIIRSRLGHIITLDDSDDQPSISIVDKTGKNSIKVDSKTNKLTVQFEGDMLFEAPKGDITMKSKTVNLEATQGFKIKGQSVDAEAQQAMSLKGMSANLEAKQGVQVKGLTADVQASTKLSLNGSAMAELKGGMVKIN